LGNRYRFFFRTWGSSLFFFESCVAIWHPKFEEEEKSERKKQTNKQTTTLKLAINLTAHQCSRAPASRNTSWRCAVSFFFFLGLILILRHGNPFFKQVLHEDEHHKILCFPRHQTKQTTFTFLVIDDDGLHQSGAILAPKLCVEFAHGFVVDNNQPTIRVSINISPLMRRVLVNIN
jgi:hypothetical protein